MDQPPTNPEASPSGFGSAPAPGPQAGPSGPQGSPQSTPPLPGASPDPLFRPSPQQPGPQQPLSGFPGPEQPSAYAYPSSGYPADPSSYGPVLGGYSTPPASPPAPRGQLIMVLGGAAFAFIAFIALLLACVASIPSLSDVAATTSTPEVGDCIQEDGNDITVVDCDSSAAEYEIIGIEPTEVTREEFDRDSDPCPSFPEAERAYWYGRSDSSGRVFCVVSVR